VTHQGGANGLPEGMLEQFPPGFQLVKNMGASADATATNQDEKTELTDAGSPLVHTFQFNNYLSFGVDAQTVTVIASRLSPSF
jgi:hypothetical protein